MLKAGDPAPKFAGHTQDDQRLGLADFAGKKLALYFYPKDDTPGCTRQACNLRDHRAALAQEGFEVVGVSADSVKSHDRFARKYQLNFPLIADHDRAICQAYGVWGEKKMYGRTYFGIKRTTFLIDEAGQILKVIASPKTATHAQEILAAVAQ